MGAVLGWPLYRCTGRQPMGEARKKGEKKAHKAAAAPTKPRKLGRRLISHITQVRTTIGVP